MLFVILAQLQCVPHIDTLQDTIYAVVTPARPTPGATRASLTPYVTALGKYANSQGAQIMTLGHGPEGPIVDLRTGGTHQPLPPMFAQVPGPRNFTIHRDGKTPYPDSVTADSLALHMTFRVGPDSTNASAPFMLRRIFLLPIKQQAHALPDNPHPVFKPGGPKVKDMALVQFAVTADGLADTTTLYPIRAGSQASVDAIRAVLPALRFAPALALNDCPARTVLPQTFTVTPP